MNSFPQQCLTPVQQHTPLVQITILAVLVLGACANDTQKRRLNEPVVESATPASADSGRPELPPDDSGGAFSSVADSGDDIPVLEQALADADVGGLVGDDCGSNEDCLSGVCWNYTDVDPTCVGRMCSMPCDDSAQCVEAARAIQQRRAGEWFVYQTDKSHYASCRDVCDFSFVFAHFACQ